MQAMDLRARPPRRWNARIDGIPWLPRLIDKTRAAQAGTLGAYLFGQSPMDRECLHAFGLGHREFARIVAASPTDEAVLAALIDRDPAALERARRWSDGFERRHAAFLFVIDLDDGYLPGPWQALKPVSNLLANALTWTVKRVWPSRAIEPAGE
ncbi:MAG TPA: DUF5069 domain-containing protein [Candidatus Aquilonibacter sp.]|nr:DUF5069 domain-containing protein [Candidatus Aquilonibacter sp.]